MLNFLTLKFYRLLSLLGCACCLLEAHAQNGNIRGFLYEKETGEPVIFTNVYLLGTTYGAATDVNGYYSITKIQPGTYTLTVTSFNYDTIREPVTIKEGDIITKKLYLEKSSVQLRTVEISAQQQEKQKKIQVSVQSIDPKINKKLPAVGGEADIAQTLQIIPGIIFTGDQGGQLYIRGGSPIQNKVLLDGMIVYNPFHSIGLFSVFDADIIRHADVYTGGFGAQYGGRISSVMDITTRDGNKTKIGGKVSASPFGAKALLEGPIKKQTDPGKGTASYILSAKHSYLPQTSKILYGYINDGEGLPFRFNDYYGKLSLNGVNGSKWNLFGFNFNDNVVYKNLSEMGWSSMGIGSNFLLIPSNSSVLVKGNVAYSSYGVSFEQESVPARESDINGFNLGLDFTYFTGKNEIQYGIEVLGFKTAFTFYNPVNRLITQAENTSELAGYFRYKLVSINRLLIEPSFRAQYYASLNNFSPEPRLGFKYNATEKLRFKFAGGLYSQNLLSASSDRDVVNLFYGFLSGPDNLPSTFTEKDGQVRELKHRLQKANHLILGMEYDLFQHIDLNIEVYQKNFTQLTNLNRNKIYDDNTANADKPDQLKKDFIIETGKAQGIDLLLKYDHKNLYVWAVYSLGFVNRWDGIQEYVPHFDRRHNVNIVTSYTFGKNQLWEADFRWNLGSGFPFTQTQGFYEELNFNENIDFDYTKANGQLGILYGNINTGRLPYYHRLDMTVKRKFLFSETSVLEASIGASNVYNRENIFYFDRVNYKRVNQLPIMPSISLSWNF